MSVFRQRKNGGFADTKRYPHKNHPAKYNRLGNDDIEYITFTHHKQVKLGNQIFDTIPLTSNIDKEERRKTKNKSHVFPKVFIGKRSALGKENKNYDLIKEDNVIVNDLFKTLPKEKVPYNSNSYKKSKRKK